MAVVQRAEYDVGESNIQLWSKQKERLQKLSHSKTADRGKTAQFQGLEIELVKCVTDCRMQGYAVSTTELRLKATHLARQSDNTTNFRGFISWSYAFLKRMVFLYDGKPTLHKGYHLTTRNNSLSSSHSLFNSERTRCVGTTRMSPPWILKKLDISNNSETKWWQLNIWPNFKVQGP